MSHFEINGILYEMLIGIVKCIKGALTYEKMDISIIIFTIKIKMKRLNNMIKM